MHLVGNFVTGKRSESQDARCPIGGTASTLSITLLSTHKMHATKMVATSTLQESSIPAHKMHDALMISYALSASALSITKLSVSVASHKNGFLCIRLF